MTNKKWIAAMLGAAAMAMSAGALAQKMDTGWYVGADIGQADFGDEDDTGFRILGGYQINRNFAAEVAYVMPFDKSGVEVTAWEFVGIGSLPVGNKFSIFGKLGFAMIDVEFPGGSDDSTELTYGAGVQYDLTPKLGLRGQWQRYDTDADEEADVMSIGIVYKF
jgi:OmpA-OmpF porin, OOP family